ncbi:MAG: carboxylesterase/lipase family protein [Lachnospiraceae bacterium]|nr:carboxylesterase/lipase family protein [Lachnospiraceae bacterium]
MEQHIVETTTGKIRGYEKEGQIAFLGIPYAKPPVGKLRLKRAVPIEPWEGVLDAKEYGSPAVQKMGDQIMGSEDCLTLNIRRPLEGENLPVLVFIHGGGYNTGSASDPLIVGDSFVRNGIVYVSFQYRLNVWGFYDFTGYPGCDGFESNCGLSDHIAAMQWIHKNISAFGGDPDRVTISGESAGGTSAVMLMAVPDLKGTFQQVIASSGLPNGVFSHEMNKKHIELFMEGMGWTEADLYKLADIDPFEVLKGNDFIAKMHQYRYPGINLPSPVVDDLLPERPIEAIKKGCAKGIRLMIGNNLNEGTFFVRKENTFFPNSWEMIQELFKNNSLENCFEEAKAYYESGSHGEVNGVDEAFINFGTDLPFQVPAIKTAQAQKEHGSVWMYRYEYITEFGRKTGMLCSHAMDLPCDFNYYKEGFPKMQFEGEPEDVVENLVNSVHMGWVNFVKYGIPDGEEWPEYTGYDSPVRIYDREIVTRSLPERRELMKLWENLHFYED